MTRYRLDRLAVMVVDENRYMLSLIADILLGLMIRDVTLLTNAGSALAEMKVHPVDLLITALRLDGIDGMELTRILRTSPDSPDGFLPIIALTGHGQLGTIKHARDIGVTEMLTKPFSANGLYLRILETIEHPRPFIRARNFFGPDRRRHFEPYDETERRVQSPREVSSGGVQMFPAKKASRDLPVI